MALSMFGVYSADGGNIEGEYIHIKFHGKDKLYMPLDQIPLLHKYVGANAKPKLSGLYDGSWEKNAP